MSRQLTQPPAFYIDVKLVHSMDLNDQMSLMEQATSSKVAIGKEAAFAVPEPYFEAKWHFATAILPRRTALVVEGVFPICGERTITGRKWNSRLMHDYYLDSFGCAERGDNLLERRLSGSAIWTMP